MELECLAGKKAKQWRQTLLHRGKPLGDYNLTSPLPLGSSDNSTNSFQDVLSVQGVNQVLSQRCPIVVVKITCLDLMVMFPCCRVMLGRQPLL